MNKYQRAWNKSLGYTGLVCPDKAKFPVGYMILLNAAIETAKRTGNRKSEAKFVRGFPALHPGDSLDYFLERFLDHCHNYIAKNYKVYLKTNHWKTVRDAFGSQTEPKCSKCGSEVPLNIHHKTYANVGRELLEDLVWLCNYCHRKHHKKKKKQ